VHSWVLTVISTLLKENNNSNTSTSRNQHMSDDLPHSNIIREQGVKKRRTISEEDEEVINL
jgi:hypothetical protein